MLDILIENLENIYEEVQTKVLPENIRGGVTLFGVEGTYGGDPEDTPSELITSFVGLIDDSRGANCTKLPDGITEIGDYAFIYKSNLALTELPETVTSIGVRAFRECHNLKLKKLPKNLQILKEHAFYDTDVEFTELPEGITEIPNYCFYDTNVAITELPANVTNVGSNAFYSVKALQNLEVKATSLTIGDYAFRNSSLEKLILRNITGLVDISGTRFSTGVLFYVPDDLVESFKTTYTDKAEQIKGLSELVS